MGFLYSHYCLGQRMTILWVVLKKIFRGNFHVKIMELLLENLKRAPKTNESESWFCVRGFKSFSPLKGTSSKTTHSLTPTLFWLSSLNDPKMTPRAVSLDFTTCCGTNREILPRKGMTSTLGHFGTAFPWGKITPWWRACFILASFRTNKASFERVLW